MPASNIGLLFLLGLVWMKLNPWLVVGHGRFGTMYRSNPQGSSGRRRIFLGLRDL
jgi:hypothetical protein